MALVITIAVCRLPTADAQEPVLLRLNPPQGQVTRYRAEMDAWLRTPLLASTDTSQPTVHITSHLTRIVTTSDGRQIELTDHTDSSRFDFPALRNLMPPGTSSDLLRGMRAVTRLDVRGRSVATTVVDAPNLPSGMPSLIRGVHGLAVAVARLATVSLPDSAVRPGDTWTDSLSFDLGNTPGLEQVAISGGGNGLATMRLDRVEERQGRRIAVISAAASANAGAGDVNASATMAMSATSIMELDMEAGRFVRTSTSLTGPMVSRLGIIPVRLNVVLLAQ